MITRKRYEWRLRGQSLQLGERTLIMGILNITPDSFSDGGKYAEPDRAFARAIELEEQGADIIDIGAESTRPGSQRVNEGEELRRLIPVLKRLKNQLSVPISVDTYKSAVAEKALEHGAAIINDPSGLTFDPGLAKTVAQNDAGLILNHMRGTPETWAKLAPIPDLIGTLVHDLEAAVNRARMSTVERPRIVIDPGLGFGKRKEQNAKLIAGLDKFNRLDLPIVIGPSRKAFLAQQTEDETRFASAAAVTAAILNGAHVVRVHDVREMRAAGAIADMVARSIPDEPLGEVALLNDVPPKGLRKGQVGVIVGQAGPDSFQVEFRSNGEGPAIRVNLYHRQVLRLNRASE
jgi:dihydropteroate synthase